MKELISKGSFGVIHRVVHRSSGAEYALKQVQLKSMTRAERQEAIDEVRHIVPRLLLCSHVLLHLAVKSCSALSVSTDRRT